MAFEPLAHVDTGGNLPAVFLVHGMTFSKATWDRSLTVSKTGSAVCPPTFPGTVNRLGQVLTRRW